THLAHKMRRLHQDAVEGQGRPRRRERPPRPATEVEPRAQGPGAGEPLVEIRQDDQRDSRARGADGVAQSLIWRRRSFPRRPRWVAMTRRGWPSTSISASIAPARLATTDLEVDEAD